MVEATAQRKPKVKRVQFGDGYEQRSKDGINADLKTYSLKFVKRDIEINDIERFLEEKGGVESFLYSHKRGALRLCICEEWSRVDIDFQTSEISATFREVVN